MKSFIPLLCFTVLTALVIAKDTVNNTKNSRDLSYCNSDNRTVGDNFVTFDSTKPATAVNHEELWKNSVERGAKLLQGMKSNDKDAAILYGTDDTAESVYDGYLKDTLREWGYNDNTEELQQLYDAECDFNNIKVGGHVLKMAFDELGLNTASKRRQGRNECFQIEHYDGPAVKLNSDGGRPEKSHQYYQVCGKGYRVRSSTYYWGQL